VASFAQALQSVLAETGGACVEVIDVGVKADV
jgi:hypothetical protein